MTLRSGFGKYGVAAGGGGFQITGGNMLAPGDGYTYHVFLASNNSTTTTSSMNVNLAGVPLTASAMVVGGGGAGGWSIGGGGGAGGLLFADNNINLADGNYVVTIGAGGGGHADASDQTPTVDVSNRRPGADSSFYHPTTPVPTRAVALGGGGGGNYGAAGPLTPSHVNYGLTGGSAGGTGGQHPTQVSGSHFTAASQPAVTGWSHYGNNGGPGSSGGYAGGGGGGAGGAGGSRTGGSGRAVPIFPGPGMGLPAIPSNIWGAGGSGSNYPNSSPRIGPINDIGGAGGYQPGPLGPYHVIRHGVTNSGSGGGAVGYGGGEEGRGGSGIVIVRYQTP